MKPENKETLESMAMDCFMTADACDDEKDAQVYFNRGVSLLEKVKEAEEAEMNAENQAEKIVVEREKIKSQEKCEEMKQSISWKRAAFDLSKVIIPVLISGGLYIFGMEKTGRFEESGRWNSDVSRMVRNNGPKLKY